MYSLYVGTNCVIKSEDLQGIVAWCGAFYVRSGPLGRCDKKITVRHKKKVIFSGHNWGTIRQDIETKVSS